MGRWTNIYAKYTYIYDPRLSGAKSLDLSFISRETA